MVWLRSWTDGAAYTTVVEAAIRRHRSQQLYAYQTGAKL